MGKVRKILKEGIEGWVQAGKWVKGGSTDVFSQHGALQRTLNPEDVASSLNEVHEN